MTSVRLVRKGKLCWESERGTAVSVGHHGTQVRVTHRMTAEESWVPCDRIGWLHDGGCWRCELVA